MDHDGTFTISETLRVEVTNTKLVWRVFPNPATDIINVIDEHGAKVSGMFRIQQTNGKTILQTSVNPVNVSNLKSGYYNLQIIDQQKNIKSIPFIISK